MAHRPIAINQTLWQVLDSLKIKDEICSRMIQKSWNDILGVTLARNAEYQGFHDSVLAIKVVHAAWQKEFKRYEKELIAKFNTYLGTRMITKIHVIAPSFGDKKTVRKGRGRK